MNIQTGRSYGSTKALLRAVSGLLGHGRYALICTASVLQIQKKLTVEGVHHAQEDD